ncbi:glycosyltransferase family 2 protein [uncultured Sphingobacterium sp.]|uniref:glycosyltransferase family 2 protein n=1 Tax=uncultured Sphingobacterium sp. TaxID=182688 RepID=UPI0037482A13
MSNEIEVTILMAAFNASKFIADSIKSALNQTFQNFELLIINDGSTDNTETIIQSFHDPRIRVIKNETNRGLIESRNIALLEAQGNFIAILDSDDIAIPDRLEKQLNAFQNNPDLAVVGSRALIIDQNGNETGERLDVFTDIDKIKITLFFENTIVHSSTMIKTKIFKEVNGYQGDILIEDYDLFYRISQKYAIENLEDYLVKYRIHGTNISIRKRDQLDQALYNLKIRQVNQFALNVECKYIAILLANFRSDNYTLEENFYILALLKEKNKQYNIYKQEAFSKELYNKWFEIVIRAGKFQTIKLLLKKPLFEWHICEFRHLRKGLKQTLSSFLKR